MESEKMTETTEAALSKLALLETGELDVRAARKLVAEILAVRTDADAGADIYASFRTWVGRLLRSSAGGDDLRAWYNLLKATGAQFRGELSEWSVRLGVLGELVFERVAMAETRDQDQVLSRRHTRAILNELLAAPGWRMGRAELRTRLGLEQANLTRVCTMLMDAGLVSRAEDGRSVSFALTADGAARARPRVEADPAAALAERQGTEWEVAIETQTTSPSPMDEWARFDRPADALPIAA
jgi:predicted transcriptional regulator